MRIIFYNFWPKVVTLILAVSTWFYVFDLVNIEPQKKETIEDVLARSTMAMKDVPVKLVFTGKTPEGFKVNFRQVKVKPAVISIVGPETLLEKLEEIKSDRINLSEYTRSTELHLGLHSNIRHLRLEEKVVDVILPIEKIKEDTR